MSNDRLPIDVLVDIFSYYQLSEDLFCPLETLLLVCKYWSTAALSYRALWANFAICIWHEPFIQIWRARLPLRLARSGSFTPLDISIDADIEQPSQRRFDALPFSCLKESEGSATLRCTCAGKRERFIGRAIDTLAGLNGERCKRWRSLKLRLGGWKCRVHISLLPQPQENGVLLRGLTYPTPSLQTLEIQDAIFMKSPPYSTVYTLFPSTPVLQQLVLQECGLPNQLLFPNARSVTIRQMKSWDIRRVQEPVLLAGAVLVKELEISLRGQLDVKLPSELLQLKKIVLAGVYVPRSLDGCRLPQLNHLVLNLGQTQINESIFSFYSTLLTQITLLEIVPYSNNLEPLSHYHLRWSLLPILRKVSTSLARIQSTQHIHSIVLKWLWESNCPPGLRKPGPATDLHFPRGIVLSTGDSVLELSGDERREDLECFAEGWGIPSPVQSWYFIMTKVHESCKTQSFL